jgi:ATP synthase F1 complex assembly factor 1
MGNREGVRDLDALKTKVLAPSVRAALKVKKAREAIVEDVKVESTPTSEAVKENKAKPSTNTKREQAKGDRAGVKVR